MKTYSPSTGGWKYPPSELHNCLRNHLQVNHRCEVAGFHSKELELIIGILRVDAQGGQKIDSVNIRNHQDPPRTFTPIWDPNLFVVFVDDASITFMQFPQRILPVVANSGIIGGVKRIQHKIKNASAS